MRISRGLTKWPAWWCGKTAAWRNQTAQVHHPHRHWQRRFRQHARSRDAALLAFAAGEPAHARPGVDRRRPRTTALSRGRGSETLGIINQPLASIAKREEIIYVYGQENEPVKLDRFSPILHLIQSIRDEAHRFAVTFHRTRRNAARLTSELDQIPGVGEKTVQKLLREFGSPELVRSASEDDLARVAGRTAARRLKEFYAPHPETV